MAQASTSAGSRRSKALARHAEAPPDDAWHEWAKHQDRPLAVDLFCGGGGLSWGLEAAGYRVALSVDTDVWSLESHSHNSRQSSSARSRHRGSREAVIIAVRSLNIDLVAGGPPCSVLLLGGKLRSLVENGCARRHDRDESFGIILGRGRVLKPRVVLMENAPTWRSETT